MRSASRLAAALLLAGAALTVQAQAPTVRVLVQRSPLAGFAHYAAAAVWPQLQVGDALELVREPDNAHDPNAVRVAWRGHMLGYLPRRSNGAVAWGLDRGARLHARIRALAAHPNPARRFELEVLVE